MVIGGILSWFSGISSKFISFPSASKDEHAVYIDFSTGEFDEILKCVAFCSFLRGSYVASRIKQIKSAQE